MVPDSWHNPLVTGTNLASSLFAESSEIKPRSHIWSLGQWRPYRGGRVILLVIISVERQWLSFVFSYVVWDCDWCTSSSESRAFMWDGYRYTNIDNIWYHNCYPGKASFRIRKIVRSPLKTVIISWFEALAWKFPAPLVLILFNNETAKNGG